MLPKVWRKAIHAGARKDSPLGMQHTITENGANRAARARYPYGATSRIAQKAAHGASAKGRHSHAGWLSLYPPEYCGRLRGLRREAAGTSRNQ
ncbi:hypothetical protein BN2475_280058 [Paraburkholderia ribeironis]|uniref:Uncharacterized protein n=1 Tax=Paraburkholderia ribeironis TaxID=1247936 RepID=A0A1N7S1F0_9BURK|nr:hypothetical protein BN2475_280058 [Paraburkholderia ribeironis]